MRVSFPSGFLQPFCFVRHFVRTQQKRWRKIGTVRNSELGVSFPSGFLYSLLSINSLDRLLKTVFKQIILEKKQLTLESFALAKLGFLFLQVFFT